MSIPDVGKMPSIGNRIRQARKRAGLTQKDLASAIKYDIRTFQRYEKDEYPPPFPVLSAIAEATNCRPEWLETGVGEPRLLSASEKSQVQNVRTQARTEIRERSRRAGNSSYGDPVHLINPDLAPTGSSVVHIPLVSVTASAGNGSAVVQEEVASFLTYDRAAIRRETGVDPARIRFMVAGGTSMQPTIHPGDQLMVEMIDGSGLEDSKVYIWRTVWGDIAVKRAHLRGRKVIVKGDNDTEPAAEIIRSDDSPEWVPVARVIRIIKPS